MEIHHGHKGRNSADLHLKDSSYHEATYLIYNFKEITSVYVIIMAASELKLLRTYKNIAPVPGSFSPMVGDLGKCQYTYQLGILGTDQLLLNKSFL